MTPPPLPGRNRPKYGCLFGCLGAVLVTAILIVMATVYGLRSIPFGATSNSQRLPVSPEYVGEWYGEGMGSRMIRIWPNGNGDYAITGAGNSSSISGGRATLDPEKRSLSIKLFFFGHTWHVDAPPHTNHGQMEMTLDGIVYRRVMAPSTPNNGQTI